VVTGAAPWRPWLFSLGHRERACYSRLPLASIPLMVAYVAGRRRPSIQAGHGLLGGVTIGLFITIALIGGAGDALLGRMLGDVGQLWQILVGAVLIWWPWGCWASIMHPVESLLGRFSMKGLPGAFALGLSYGHPVGSCTFGFIAPILAIITVQGDMPPGRSYRPFLLSVIACRSCWPGSSTAMVKNLLESRVWQGAGSWFAGAPGSSSVPRPLFHCKPFITG